MPTLLDVAAASLIPENRFLIHYGNVVVGLLTLDDVASLAERTTDPVMALLLEGAAFSLRWRDLLEGDSWMLATPDSPHELGKVRASDEPSSAGDLPGDDPELSTRCIVILE